MADIPSPQQPSLLETLKFGPLQVLIVGAGSWGTTVAKIIAPTCADHFLFHSTVNIWVHTPELVMRAINETHENIRYLPGIKLPENVVAVSDLKEAAKQADLLIFATPSQYVAEICTQLKGGVKVSARALSLVKGVWPEGSTPSGFSRLVCRELGVDCCALSGANVALGVALGEFAEATIGYYNYDNAALWLQLLTRPAFRVAALPDRDAVEMCGALKNVIAMAAGFCDGMNWGSNTKAAVIRIGITEMKNACLLFHSTALETTFFESAGFADVITTCYGGRNVKCAAEFVRRKGAATWAELEKELLNGQKLQGHLTCEAVYRALQERKAESAFPLFTSTYKIAFEKHEPWTLTQTFQAHPPPSPIKREHCTAVATPAYIAQLAKQ